MLLRKELKQFEAQVIAYEKESLCQNDYSSALYWHIRNSLKALSKRYFVVKSYGRDIEQFRILKDEFELLKQIHR